MNPETKFKHVVKNDLEKNFPDAYILKTQEVGRRGVPDFILCISSRFYAIELKTDGNKADPLQSHTISRIRNADGIAFVTTPSEWPDHLEMLQKHG